MTPAIKWLRSHVYTHHGFHCIFFVCDLLFPCSLLFSLCGEYIHEISADKRVIFIFNNLKFNLVPRASLSSATSSSEERPWERGCLKFWSEIQNPL